MRPQANCLDTKPRRRQHRRRDHGCALGTPPTAMLVTTEATTIDTAVKAGVER